MNKAQLVEAVAQATGLKKKEAEAAVSAMTDTIVAALQNGEKVVEKRIVSSIANVINPYEEFDALLAYAADPQIRFVVSNTTEAGIAYDPACGANDKPAASFPGLLPGAQGFMPRRMKSGFSQQMQCKA